MVSGDGSCFASGLISCEIAEEWVKARLQSDGISVIPQEVPSTGSLGYAW